MGVLATQGVTEPTLSGLFAGAVHSTDASPGATLAPCAGDGLDLKCLHGLRQPPDRVQGLQGGRRGLDGLQRVPNVLEGSLRRHRSMLA